ncbi:phosphoenolpyruvate carboxykinase (GTP) [Candidatus Saganbacteria bacterium]|nr:phosphoenolpyruvate carboxykinase (GTP) [Candidatus Saganbacteria bacterium]
MSTKHKELAHWVKECAELCKPDKVVWCDGSDEEKNRLEKDTFRTGELIKLDQKKLPGCVYNRTAINDVARTEHLTYVCTRDKNNAGPNNNWLSPKDGYQKAADIFRNSMHDRIMYIIPFSMGPVGSPFSKIGVQITDSAYVVLNMRIMTRMGKAVLDLLEKTNGDFTRCLHGKADLDVNRRLILHFPEDNTIWSVGSGYGGNALLGKKCLSLRLGSYLGQREGWLAEHMLIMGIEDPQGYIGYIAAAFPSACGKTNLAMLLPPEGLKRKGYRIWTVGDDIAWMRIDTDGRLWAVNPENGLFGVAPGTNSRTNPNIMAAIKKNTIYTNVLLKKDKTVWWEGGDPPVPANGIDWQGRAWTSGQIDENGEPILGAHPNSRFTVPIQNVPSITNRLEHHHGVPIAAIIFGGRRARLAPLVYEAFNWQHGVFVGATMASERTAAQVGKIGEVRRDPMAMLPFCGYNMGKYFAHWLVMGKKMSAAPRIFNVNWFRKDEKGQFLWPGFGDNLRVLEWIISRCKNEVDALKTSIGNVPHENDIDLTGLRLTREHMHKLFAIHKKDWQQELEGIDAFFKTFGNTMPKEMWHEYRTLQKRLTA